MADPIVLCENLVKIYHDPIVFTAADRVVHIDDGYISEQGEKQH